MKLISSENRAEALKKSIDKKAIKVVAQAAKELDRPCYVVGGYVRDALLGREVKDIDFVTIGSGIELAYKVAELLGGKSVQVFKNFGTAMIKDGEYDLEFVGARKESYNRGSRKPVVEDGSLEDDQNRRDFTINAMAISLNESDFGALVDPFDGMADLEKKIIRTPLNPDKTYSDDPLRMMRAVRFASQLGFEIEAESWTSIKRNADRLDIISKERIITELNKIILSPTPSRGFKALLGCGLLERFFPEMIDLLGVETRNGRQHKDNFYHTLEVLDNLSANTDKLYLRWSAIMHDIAKPATKRFDQQAGWTFHGHEDKGARMVPKIFKRLRLPLDQNMKYVQKLVLLHLRPIALTKEEITDSAVRRLLFDAGDDIDDLMMLCRADITSKNERKVKRYLENYDKVILKLQEVEENDRVRNWQPPITGELIMETFGISPCRAIGAIKSHIKEAILDGDIENDYDSAYALMLKKGAELGLEPVS